MRKMGLLAFMVLGAFALGVTGIPGDAMAAAADWLVDSGNVELAGPVGDAVRQAI